MFGIVSHHEIEADLQQIESALMRISDARIRYWIAQFVELTADGVDAAQDRAKTVAQQCDTPSNVTQGSSNL